MNPTKRTVIKKLESPREWKKNLNKTKKMAIDKEANLQEAMIIVKESKSTTNSEQKEFLSEIFLSKLHGNPSKIL